MGWNNDIHGLLFKSNELKLYRSSHTWGMKLSQLPKQAGIVRIITYSLPSMSYVEEQLGRRPRDIFLLCHEKFIDRARAIKALYPDIRVAVHGEIHSKVLLIAPNTVYITSSNFGNSTWHETSIGVRSKEAHDYFVDNEYSFLWSQASELD